MKLYHFSDNNFKILSPQFFGHNAFTKNDKKYSLKRAFCYDTKTPVEYCFKNAIYRYIVNIDKKNIYDLDQDVLGLKIKYDYNIDKILSYTSKHYDAICYFTSFKTYAIFKKCNVFKQDKLN